MEYTVLPSMKGQITLPPVIRKKYDICKNTPLVIEDMGNGEIKVKVKRAIDHDLIQYYEKNGSVGLHFKNGVDPQILIDMINKIDGQD